MIFVHGLPEVEDICGCELRLLPAPVEMQYIRDALVGSIPAITTVEIVGVCAEQDFILYHQIPDFCWTFVFVPAGLAWYCMLNAAESLPRQVEVELEFTVATTAAIWVFMDQYVTRDLPLAPRQCER